MEVVGLGATEKGSIHSTVTEDKGPLSVCNPSSVAGKLDTPVLLVSPPVTPYFTLLDGKVTALTTSLFDLPSIIAWAIQPI